MDPMIKLLKLGLDGASLRQEALASNIANLDTPGYKRKDVNFITLLKDQLAEVDNGGELSLKRTDPAHQGDSSENGLNPFQVQVEESGSSRNDKNNVDIDYEMAELAKNNIYYNTLANQLNARFRLLKDVISKANR